MQQLEAGQREEHGEYFPEKGLLGQLLAANRSQPGEKKESPGFSKIVVRLCGGRTLGDFGN